MISTFDAAVDREVRRHVIPVLQNASAALLMVAALAAPQVDGPVAISGAELPDGMLGANGHVLWDESPADELRLLTDAGIDWIRSDFDWQLLEPSPGQYDWTSSDRLMTAAARAGVNVLAIVDYSAPWASSDPSGGGDVNYPPRDDAEYARFAAAIAARYGTGGTFWNQNPGLAPRPITAMEVWNEPFGHWFWKPNPDVAAYARLVRATAAAVEPVDPAMWILAAGDARGYRTSEQYPWLEDLLAADPGLPTVIDAWAIHPYPDPAGLAPWEEPTDIRRGVRWRVEEAIRVSTEAAKPLPIWITELGWCTADAECGVVSELDQAAYLLDVVVSTATTWGPAVEKIFLYSLDASSGVHGDREGNYGLRHVDGSAKLAWASIAALNLGETPAVFGLVDPQSGLWSLSAGPENLASSFYYGNPGDVPFMGDWTCDGFETPGLYRQSDGFAYLRNSNTQGVADTEFRFGNPGDVPVAGDFDGDGCDTVSIYRPSNQTFYIINQLGRDGGGLGAADRSFLFGNPGDAPVVGDWNGDGIDDIGLYRESTGFFYYRNRLSTGIADGQFYFGDSADRLVAGDWGIPDGRETPAVFRPANHTLYFRNSLSQGNADLRFTWPGARSDWLPVAGGIGLR